MKQSTITAKVRAVFALAGIGMAIWLLIEIAISAVHGVEGVAGFRVPPGSVSEGEAWGIYAIYVALVLGSAVPLDKTETVKLPGDWLIAFLVLVALTLVPGALLLVPDHFADTASAATLTCGSWVYPSGLTAFLHYSPCVSSLESRFRWAALIAAVGLAGPYLVMVRSLHVQNRVSKAKTASGNDASTRADD
jgi:ABC-type Na+ efflux pump permease subunit